MQREMIIGKNHMKGTFTFVNVGVFDGIQKYNTRFYIKR